MEDVIGKFIVFKFIKCLYMVGEYGENYVVIGLKKIIFNIKLLKNYSISCRILRKIVFLFNSKWILWGIITINLVKYVIFIMGRKISFVNEMILSMLNIF